jgi:hypothetical protein
VHSRLAASLTHMLHCFLHHFQQTFDSKRDRGVLEDVGLMKQLGRLDEEQALDAIKNYRDAASRRGGKSILNPSAYFMVILREFIEVRRFTCMLMRFTYGRRHSSQFCNSLSSCYLLCPAHTTMIYTQTGHHTTAELSRQRCSIPYIHVSTRVSQWQQPRYEQ